MKPIPYKLAALISAAALLAACGGGGGGGNATTSTTAATPAAATTAATAPAPAPITVSSMTAPAVTAADCPRLTSESASIAALDLSNANIKALNDYLPAVDSAHAYKVFIRRPADFVNWVVAGGGTVNIDSIGLSTHETLHMVDTALAACAPAGTAKYLFMGTVVATDLQAGMTDNYGIVDETLDAALKTGLRYNTYIVAAPTHPGNDFRVLLDELAAYTGGAYTEVQMIAQGKAAGDTRSLDVNLGGMVQFMVYLENYLKAARLNHPATYATIKNSTTTISAIQTIWTQAEQVLQKAYPSTKAGAAPQLTVDASYFSAAYSAALLSELNAIGVTSHATAASWSGTYLP